MQKQAGYTHTCPENERYLNTQPLKMVNHQSGTVSLGFLQMDRPTRYTDNVRI